MNSSSAVVVAFLVLSYFVYWSEAYIVTFPRSRQRKASVTLEQPISTATTTWTTTTTTTSSTSSSSFHAAPKPLSSLFSRLKLREELEGLFSRENTFERRQRIREEIEDLEDADFLLADVKPKVLVHERDFFRQEARIQAWDEYVLVSILCTSISYNALQTFQLNPDHEGIFLYEYVVKTMIQVVAGLAVLSGLYSTMVFSLSILYGRTALGLERDPQYDDFLDETEDIRRSAFRAFSFALACFALHVILVLAEDLPLVMHLPVGGIMIGALYVGFRDWKILVDSAEDIFNYFED